jgi:hypothetical protein
MEELLIAIIQGVFEFVFEALAYLPFDWHAETLTSKDSVRLFWRCFFWFVGGCLLGWLSLYIVDHALLLTPTLRMANLIVAPLSSAFISQAIAKRRAQRDEHIEPRRSFWQAFWFSLGIVVIRFAYGHAA